MKIGIDLMGGDFAPDEVLKGIVRYFDAFIPEEGVELHLFGSMPKAENPEWQIITDQPRTVVFTECSEVIGYHEHPVKAIKSKPNSSISKGFVSLQKGEIDAFISAGNTGAMLVGSMTYLKQCTGVIRPTIGTIIPRENDAMGLLLDVGINSDCKAEHLNQFATIGSIYAQEILGIQNPTVGLLNIGEEEGKGNLLAKEAFELLKQNSTIRFAGNVEGRDILVGKSDIVVCDGFTGNIILKLLESFYPAVKRQQIDNAYFSRFDFEKYGGTPVLGVEKPVIIGHGVSTEESFYNMILLASKMIETEFTTKIGAALA